MVKKKKEEVERFKLQYPEYCRVKKEGNEIQLIKSPKRKKAEAKRKLKSTEEIGDEAKKILASKIKKAKVKPKYTSQNLDDTTDQA